MDMKDVLSLTRAARNMTPEQKIEKNFIIMSDSFMRSVESEINKPHPTIKAVDLNKDSIRNDIFSSSGEVMKDLTKFKQQVGELKQKIEKQRIEQEEDWRKQGISSGEFQMSPEMVEAMKVLTAHIQECARFIAENILHRLGMCPEPAPYRRNLTNNERHELEVSHHEDALRQVIAEDGEVRDNAEKAIDLVFADRLEAMDAWENRPERIQAMDRLDKFVALSSGPQASLFKEKTSRLHAKQVIQMLDGIELNEEGKIKQVASGIKPPSI